MQRMPMDEVDRDDEDPFLKITGDSLNLTNQHNKLERSVLGNMIPLRIGEWALTVGPDYKFFLFAFPFMVIVSLTILCTEVYCEVGALPIAITVFINLFQHVSYISILISNPGVAVDPINPREVKKAIFCSHCNLLTEATTQHCRICNVCVLGMDHHCPWTSKCIGKNNMTRFIVFVVSTLVFMLFNVVAFPLLVAQDN